MPHAKPRSPQTTWVKSEIDASFLFPAKDVAAKSVLHHDKAPSHTALRLREFLAKYNLATLLQSPYSPDLASTDFFLLTKINTALKGQRVGGIEEFQTALTTSLIEVPVEAFQGTYSARGN